MSFTTWACGILHWFDSKLLSIKEAIYIRNESPNNNNQYDNFDNTLKLFTHRHIKQKINNNITSNPDDSGQFNNNNDISFNENSIVHTSTQIPNNNKNYETSEIDHQID